MPADPRRVKELFVSAPKLSASPMRREFLNRECADDIELRERLNELLAAHEDPDSAVKRPFAIAADITPGPPPGQAKVCGR